MTLRLLGGSSEGFNHHIMTSVLKAIQGYKLGEGIQFRSDDSEVVIKVFSIRAIVERELWKDPQAFFLTPSRQHRLKSEQEKKRYGDLRDWWQTPVGGNRESAQRVQNYLLYPESRSAQEWKDLEQKGGWKRSSLSSNLLEALDLFLSVVQQERALCIIPSPSPVAQSALSLASLKRFHKEEARSLRLCSRAPLPMVSSEDQSVSSELMIFESFGGSLEIAVIAYGFTHALSSTIEGTLSASASLVVAMRMHSACLTGDALGSLRCDCGSQLAQSQNELARRTKMGQPGLLFYLPQEGRGLGLSGKMKAYAFQQEQELNTLEANLILGAQLDERNYEAVIEILKQLDVKSVALLTSNPDKKAVIQQSEVDLKEVVQMKTPSNPKNADYMQDKKVLFGHNL